MTGTIQERNNASWQMRPVRARTGRTNGWRTAEVNTGTATRLIGTPDSRAHACVCLLMYRGLDHAPMRTGDVLRRDGKATNACLGYPTRRPADTPSRKARQGKARHGTGRRKPLPKGCPGEGRIGPKQGLGWPSCYLGNLKGKKLAGLVGYKIKAKG